MTKDGQPKIYLLPNLMTAGNLFCGFIAIVQVFHGMLAPEPIHSHYYMAIGLILGACVFDLLDGRVARMGNRISPFGREFDSLADLISFGVAPALLVYDIVLAGLNERIGWMIAFAYLLAGAMRLARFNVMAESRKEEASGDFVGLPIPAAAGMIASLTLFLLWLDDGQREIGRWKYVLPLLMLLLSYLMASSISYPSFKAITWKTRRSMPMVVGTILILVMTVMNWEWMPAILFVTYMIYGIARPWISRRWRAEIEQEEESFATPESSRKPDDDQGFLEADSQS
jgi:CDP-diacylglycerol--serine O-phosphatidyltransferase